MRPVKEETRVVCQCVNDHQWVSDILPGNTMPQTPGCPDCGSLVAFYPSLKEEARKRKNAARRAKNQAMRDLGLVRVRGNLGGTYWE